MRNKDLREKASQMLAGKWMMAVLVTLVAGLFGATAIHVPSINFNFNFEMDMGILEDLPEELAALLAVYFVVAASVASIVATAQFVLGGVIRLGYCRYLLNLHDGGNASFKDLFSQFHRFGAAFLLNLLMAVYTFLWTLLFIIPGIVACYKYAMAPFILLENPGMSANQAITASKQMMKGHKGKLFLLGLSFFGWAMLCILSWGVGYLWLNPYMNASYAAFYRSLNPGYTPQNSAAYTPQWTASPYM